MFCCPNMVKEVMVFKAGMPLCLLLNNGAQVESSKVGCATCLLDRMEKRPVTVSYRSLVKPSLLFSFFLCAFCLQRKCPRFHTPKFLMKWHMQTVKTQIRPFLKEQSDQGLHCLPFYKVFLKQLHEKQTFGQNKVWNKVLEIIGHFP